MRLPLIARQFIADVWSGLGFTGFDPKESRGPRWLRGPLSQVLLLVAHLGQAAAASLSANGEGRMKMYRGTRGKTGCIVTVDGSPLTPPESSGGSVHIAFDWGRPGEGAQLLGLALLTDHFGSSERASEIYREFAVRVLAPMTTPEWELSSIQIRDHLGTIISAQ